MDMLNVALDDIPEEEKLLDERYKFLLLEKGRCFKQVETLEHLTIKVVVKLLEQTAHCNKEVDVYDENLRKFLKKPALCNPAFRLMDNVSQPIVELVKNSLSYVQLRNFEIIKQFISESTREVCIRGCIEEEETTVLVQMLEICLERLTSLTIIYCYLGDGRIHLHNFLNHSSNLQELKLIACGLTNQTIEIVASTCTNLRNLEIQGNHNVTDEGLMLLCNGVCTKIQKLDITRTSFSLQCSVNLIYKLSQLEKIMMVESSLEDEDITFCNTEAFIMFINQYPNVFLMNLKYLVVNYYVMFGYLEKILTIAPNITEVKLHYLQNNITSLLNLNNLQKLTVNFLTASSEVLNIDVPLVISKFSNTLTYVRIVNIKRYNDEEESVDRDLKIDLSIFGKCVNLNTLVVSNYNYNCKPNHIMNTNSFKKLCYFSISSLTTEKNSLNKEIFFKIMTSPCLKRISILNITIPEKMFISLITEAQINTNLFSKLLTFLDIGKQSYSFNTVLEIITTFPKPNVEVSNVKYLLRKEDHEKFEAFRKRNDTY